MPTCSLTSGGRRCRARLPTACNLCAQEDFTVHPIAHDVAALGGQGRNDRLRHVPACRIPSWFLQNYECLLAATLHKMLVHFVSANSVTDRTRRRAFGVLLTLPKGYEALWGWITLQGQQGHTR